MEQERGSGKGVGGVTSSACGSTRPVDVPPPLGFGGFWRGEAERRRRRTTTMRWWSGWEETEPSASEV
uniref:Uncharacterized protein n=1 Tax=Oryza meridionalis TaxID=40149 RepID=A0A0E0CEX5_9ORYZ